MKEYDFTLKLILLDPTANPENFVEQLGAAGCDDAIIGIGQQGRIALHFYREAENGIAAVYSAIEEVKSVVDNIKSIDIQSDSVELADINNRLYSE
jgi:hypothetical protein